MKTIIDISTFAPTYRTTKGETKYIHSLQGLSEYAFDNIYGFDYKHDLEDCSVTEEIYTYMKEKYSLTDEEFNIFKQEIDIDINTAICDSERNSYGVNYYKAMWRDLVKGIYITYPFAKSFKLVNKDKTSLELTDKTSIIFQAGFGETSQVEIEYLKKDFDDWKRKQGYDKEMDIEEVEPEIPRYDYEYADSSWSYGSTDKDVIEIFKDTSSWGCGETIGKYKKDIFIYEDIKKYFIENDINYTFQNLGEDLAEVRDLLGYIYGYNLFKEDPMCYFPRTLNLNDEIVWTASYNDTIRGGEVRITFSYTVEQTLKDTVKSLEDLIKLLNDYNRKAKFLKY